jgi:phosphopantetheine--protein transferase-like protein
MTKLYILNTADINKANIEKLITSLPFGEAERQRLLSIANADRMRESLGGLVALWRLCSLCDICLPLNICRTDTGKPYFVGNSPPTFGISHSCGFAAAAIDTSGAPLGLDMELIRKGLHTEQIAQRFFTDQEKRVFSEQNSTDECFFRIWTAKEARAKLEGVGLSSIINSNAKDGAKSTWQQIIEIGEKRLYIAICQEQTITSVDIITDEGQSYKQS